MPNLSRLLHATSLAAALLTATRLAAAEDPEPPHRLTLQPLAPDAPDAPDAPERPARPATVTRDEVPRHAFVESPFSLTGGVLMAGLTGTGTAAGGSTLGEGGVRIGASPIDRLTFHGLIGRDAQGKWAPTATMHVRFLGSLEEGYAVGALAQYKTEGFTEAGGEAEIGITAGFRTRHFYLDGNLIAGLGVEESELGEMDAEAKLRLGYDLGDSLRLGAEGQLRDRLAGDRLLVGNRRRDFAGGPQVIAGLGRFVLAATGGATTVNVADRVGAFGIVTLSALTL